MASEPNIIIKILDYWTYDDYTLNKGMMAYGLIEIAGKLKLYEWKL